jgi:nicotinamidase-related amidase
VNGGLPGARSRKLLVRANGTQELMPSKLDHIKVEAGDLLIADTWGGGGWGDPLERDTGRCLRRRGGPRLGGGREALWRRHQGRRAVDAAATAALRKDIAAKRGPKKIFDRGFDTIEELKARCKAETGLEPPAPPRFTIYGHPCTAMDPRISHPSQFEYCKNGPSMFFQTPLITFLVRQQVDTVIVAGCTTSGCVRATVVDAFSYGLRVQVAEDCCGDADEGPHRDALRDVGRRYADISDSARMAEYLRSVAAT